MTPAKSGASSKYGLIDRANAVMLAIIALSTVVVIFSLIAIKFLVGQGGYQTRVIKAKTTALKQLKENNTNVTQLVSSYKAFADTSVNVLGGNPKGTGVKDGDNPKLILDALPSKYDFPGLTSSIEKLLKSGGYKIDSLGGTDDEVAQQNTASDNPQPVQIPFPISVTTNYDGAQNLLATLENSIRPMYVDSIDITAASGQLRLMVITHTFYQAEKTMKIGTKVIK